MPFYGIYLQIVATINSDIGKNHIKNGGNKLEIVTMMFENHQL